jgi:hypothetical protein
LIFGGFYGKNRISVVLEEDGRKAMKCYVCAKQGVDEQAVAICIVCGMGLCLGHAFKEELLVRDVIDWGFGEERIDYPHTHCLDSFVPSVSWPFIRGRKWKRSNPGSVCIGCREKGCLFRRDCR